MVARIIMQLDNIKSYFEQYDWDFFSEEQLLFEDNNVWLCLY